MFFPQLITEISSVGTRSTDTELKKPSASDGEASISSPYDVYISWRRFAYILVPRSHVSRVLETAIKSVTPRALPSPGTRISYRGCLSLSVKLHFFQ